MTGDARGEPPPLQALSETMRHPLRNRVYASVTERPGVTINELSRRLGEPARRIRHQIEWLVDAGMVRVDGSTPRRNTRELRYKAIHRPVLTGEDEDSMDPEDWRRVALAVVSLLVEDMRLAIDAKTFAIHPGHAVVRIPGKVDQVGWDELAVIAERNVKEIEATMRASARRLRAGGVPAIDVTAAFLLFEGSPWRLGDGEEDAGKLRSMWLDDEDT